MVIAQDSLPIFKLPLDFWTTALQFLEFVSSQEGGQQRCHSKWNKTMKLFELGVQKVHTKRKQDCIGLYIMSCAKCLQETIGDINDAESLNQQCLHQHNQKMPTKPATASNTSTPGRSFKSLGRNQFAIGFVCIKRASAHSCVCSKCFKSKIWKNSVGRNFRPSN